MLYQPTTEKLLAMRMEPMVETWRNYLQLPTKCAHAYWTIKVAGRMRRQSLDLAFEPECAIGDFQHRPDVRADVPSTGERFFVEFSCQSLANNQLSAFEAMATCQEPINRHFERLKCSFRLRTIPAPNHMQEIVRAVDEAAQAVLTTGRLAEIVEEGVLEMAICRRDNLAELDSCCKRRGLPLNGNEGPQDDTNELNRLKQKIRQKQRWLPIGYPNVLAIENKDIFLHDRRAVLPLISELQEELYQHPNLSFLLVEGSNGGGWEETGTVISQGEHRFQRRVRQGQVRHTLLCSNRFADVKPSVRLGESLSESFFDSPVLNPAANALRPS
jgi:hypothetical protein